MDNQKFELIIDRLLNLSEGNQLDWKTTAGSDKYLITLKDSSIAIQKSVGYIFLEFRNEKGEVVEKMTISQSDQKINQLFDLARRKALNADETINRIIEQLNPDSLALN